MLIYLYISGTIIKFTKLIKPKNSGGISLLNLQLYYWSAQIKHMISWCLDRRHSLSVEMESIACHPSALASLPFINSLEKILALSDNFAQHNTLLAWIDARRHLQIPDHISLWSPIALKTDTPKGIADLMLLFTQDT